MNALDVLVAPRAASGAPGTADAAPAAGETDATAGAFIALLGAMLGARPVVELKAALPLSLPLGEGGDAPVEGEAAQSEAGAEAAIPAPAPAEANLGTALVSDSELVGIARAALAIMKRNATAAKSANAAARPARPVNAIPLAQLARNAARKAERTAVTVDVPTVKGSEKKSAKPTTPELVAPEVIVANPAPAVMMAEAISAATAAVRLPAAPAPEVADSDRATTSAGNETEAVVMSPRSSAAPAPLVWTPAPTTTGTASGSTDSALVNAVTQLIDALTPAILPEAAPVETPNEPALAPAISLPNAEVTPAAAPMTDAVPTIMTSRGDALLPASVIIEEIQVKPAATPAPSIAGATVVADAPAPSADGPVINLDTPTLDITEGHEVALPKEGTRARDVAAAPLATSARGESREHDASGSEHSRREHEHPAKKLTGSDAAPQWSPVANATTTAAPATDDTGVKVSDVAAARTPDEPTRAPQATSHVTLQLDEDTLGASRIRVAVRGDTVRATILADDSKAAALTAQLPELRRALEERGFTEARVVIQVEGKQEHQGSVIAGAMTDDLRARPAASTRSESGREEQQPRGGRRQDPDGDRPRDRRRQTPKEETQ